jgi:hypothetical protein
MRDFEKLLSFIYLVAREFVISPFHRHSFIAQNSQIYVAHSLTDNSLFLLPEILDLLRDRSDRFLGFQIFVEVCRSVFLSFANNASQLIN